MPSPLVAEDCLINTNIIVTMKKHFLYQLSIILIFGVVIHSSCVRYKPTAHHDAEDYNRRINVQAGYMKKTTAIGHIFKISTTIAGGYAGYNSNLIMRQKGDERISIQPANAALGALIGYSVASLINYGMGINKEKECKDENRWLKKARLHKDYAIVNGQGNYFRIMPFVVETNYLVKNITDVSDFVKVFPKSDLRHNVADKGLQVIPRQDIPTLITLLPDNPSNLNYSKKYIDLSPSLQECIEAKKRFANLNNYAEQKSITFLKNLNDVILFNESFPNSAMADLFLMNLSLSRTEIPQVVSMYPNASKSLDLKIKYYNISENFDQYLEASNRYPAVINQESEHAAQWVKNSTEAGKFVTKYGTENQLAAFKNVLKYQDWDMIPELLTIFTGIEAATKTEYTQQYVRKMDSTFLSISKDDDNQMENFFLRFTNKYDPNGLVTKSSFYVDSIRAWSNNAEELAASAQRHPTLLTYFDRVAYYNIKTIDNADEYVRYFPSGIFIGKIAYKKDSIEYLTQPNADNFDKWKEFFTKYPNDFESLENLAYQKVNDDYSLCDGYLRNFTKGKHYDEINFLCDCNNAKNAYRPVVALAELKNKYKLKVAELEEVAYTFLNNKNSQVCNDFVLNFPESGRIEMAKQMYQEAVHYETVVKKAEQEKYERENPYFYNNASEAVKVTFSSACGDNKYYGATNSAKYAEGAGKWTSCKGDMWFEGSFKNGYYHGTGTLRLPNGVRITGPFEYGIPKGKFDLNKWYFLNSEHVAGNAYSWDDIDALESKIIDQWNANYTGSSGSSSGSTNSNKPDYENMSIPNYKEGEWTEENGVLWGTYYQCEIEFDDDVSGWLYQGGDTKRYFIKEKIYYTNKYSAIRALYLYHKYDYTLKKDRY